MRVTSDQFDAGVDSKGQLALVRNVAEDLKLPLTRVLAYVSEPVKNEASSALVRHTLEGAVDFIDTYILCLQVQSGQQQLCIEPVALSPLFDEVAHQLTPLAHEHNFDISISVSRSVKTVLSDKFVLQKLLSVLGYSFLQLTSSRQEKLLYHAHWQKGQVSAGVLSSNMQLKHRDLGDVRKNKGRASLLSKDLPYGTSAALAIADLLAHTLHNPLQTLNFNSQSGLGISLLPSSQLRLL